MTNSNLDVPGRKNGATPGLCRWAARSKWVLFVLFSFLGVGGGRAMGQNGALPDNRFELGIGLRFMPIGWFDIMDDFGRSFRAYPALGAGALLQYRVTKVVSLGVSPELSLNVIPNRADYLVGTMYGLMARAEARHPVGSQVDIFGVLGAGYSVITRAASANAHGPSASVGVGINGRFAQYHAVYFEVSYLRGWQRFERGPYAPSYVTTTLGWKVGL